MNYYKVYGLNIKSEIEVRELSILEEFERKDIDVTLRYGNVNEDIKESISKGAKANFKSQNMWFYIKGVATYHIYNGDTIIIEPCENADLTILRVYILGSVLGLVLLQRNMVAIHGGAIVIDGKGCVFTGDKGAGKSTITTALRNKGYKFLSDDVASINMGEQNSINPGFGYQKLCEDTMEKLGYDTSKYEPFRSDMSIKYLVPAFEGFVSEEVPFNNMFELSVGDVDKVQIEEVQGIEKIDKFMKNIFRIEMMQYAGGVNSDYFNKCISIMKSIKFYKIIRPKDIFTVEDQIGLIKGVI